MNAAQVIQISNVMINAFKGLMWSQYTVHVNPQTFKQLTTLTAKNARGDLTWVVERPTEHQGYTLGGYDLVADPLVPPGVLRYTATTEYRITP